MIELAAKVGAILADPQRISYTDQEIKEIIEVLKVVRSFHETRDPRSYNCTGLTLELMTFEGFREKRKNGS